MDKRKAEFYDAGSRFVPGDWARGTSSYHIQYVDVVFEDGEEAQVGVPTWDGWVFSRADLSSRRKGDRVFPRADLLWRLNCSWSEQHDSPTPEPIMTQEEARSAYQALIKERWPNGSPHDGRDMREGWAEELSDLTRNRNRSRAA